MQPTISQLLSGFPRESISLLPTPLHFLPRISERFGRRLFIKRDDLTGFAFGGNKTRKFDFLIADAIRQGCDTMVGIGANQSNFCRIMAGVGKRYGLAVHLVLSGPTPDNPTGNLKIDHLLEATVHHVNTRDSQVRMQAALELRRDLEARGHRVYFLPPGGSVPLGAFGYALAFEELLTDFQRAGLNVKNILLASSSAGTQAGLVLGQWITGWQGTITGISVDTPRETLIDDVYHLAVAAAGLLPSPVIADKTRITVDTGYIGAGYGIPTPECIEAVRLFAQMEGIFLDYVYSGKAAAGLLDYCRGDHFSVDEPVIFIHTGGNIELFA